MWILSIRARPIARRPRLPNTFAKQDGDNASIKRYQGTRAHIWTRIRLRQMTFFLIWCSAW